MLFEPQRRRDHAATATSAPREKNALHAMKSPYAQALAILRPIVAAARYHTCDEIDALPLRSIIGRDDLSHVKVQWFD
ncbi:hypothetical protein [Methylosinus trichosporium]|uniref:hypothetical protein n=1 Tax=Methylosinus trichosporium TaxID=426 RepID=UPI0012DD89A8|nr:hypothetical protein [Methylosinus trichosporium]